MYSLRTHLRLIRPIQRSLRQYTTNSSKDTLEYSEPASPNNNGTEALIYPDSQSPNHHDLPSFLSYASRISMDTDSTTYVGTHYEYTAQTALSRLGMSLKRVGGKSDYGIDLLGTWKLPSTTEELKVLVQCKAFARKLEPSQARELEGAFVGAPPGWRGPGVLALLVTQNAATKGVREALGRSRWPMGFVLCKADGRVEQMLWNRRAQQEGLDGIGVELMYGGGDVSDRRVVLTFNGEVRSG
jgi:hypothetical protein